MIQRLYGTEIVKIVEHSPTKISIVFSPLKYEIEKQRLILHARQAISRFIERKYFELPPTRPGCSCSSKSQKYNRSVRGGYMKIVTYHRWCLLKQIPICF